MNVSEVRAHAREDEGVIEKIISYDTFHQRVSSIYAIKVSYQIGLGSESSIIHTGLHHLDSTD